ncbi:hypothetical protein [Bradyrhizobium sp. NBAIM01]|uniref:hypothetical protein n=1 Tax=Bradyrhizobium sp. NBAIM01 TaxID=2793818 RepID=UPI001CD1DA9B|nr:hypothetical protein [Bradyrhizobium sp. NBAIM01]MCA1513148.1 hypothetical protein [Bradyrhizobium sp. NBAIM01]
MLATLNAKQIVDEIVKDTVKDNDPHDAVQISPEIVRASRPASVSPALAPEIGPRPEPRFAPEPKFAPQPKVMPKFSLEPAGAPEPSINVVYGKSTAAPSIDTAVRVTSSDGPVMKKRSSVGKWLRGAFVTLLLAGASVAASIAWEKHGDTAKQLLAEWTPVLTSLLPTTSLLSATPQQSAPVAAAQAAPPAAEATPNQTADQAATPPAAQLVATAPAAPQSVDAAQSVQSMTRDLAAMAQQIEQLKANIAELKAGQEQMAREMARPPAPKPVTEARPPVDPRARAAALPPQPAAAPVRKPKPPVTRTYTPASSPAPLAPPPPLSQAAATPPAAPTTTTQAVADDDGPIVRPPMPLR